MSKILDIKKIIKLIPHRYPILLVDKLLELKKGEFAIGLKNVTMNEPHFMGHFPDNPVMPGVLIIEALAQTAAIFVSESELENPENKLVYFLSIDNVKFRKTVIPGDSLKLRVDLLQRRKNVWKFSGKAFVEDDLVTEACFSAMIFDKPQE